MGNLVAVLCVITMATLRLRSEPRVTSTSHVVLTAPIDTVRMAMHELEAVSSIAEGEAVLSIAEGGSNKGVGVDVTSPPPPPPPPPPADEQGL